MSSPRLERGTCCLGGSRSIHLSYEDAGRSEDRPAPGVRVPGRLGLGWG
jgi:hypothetical protein